MTDAQKFSRVPVALVFVAALWGCASRPVEHFYTVSSENVAPATGTPAQRIVVSPIAIPALIDRPQLVVRTSGHEVAVLENHRWAEPLAVDLARALVNDLHRVRPGLDIMVGNASRTRAEQNLEVTITELVSGPGSRTSFEASWVLHDPQGNCVNEGHLEAAIPTQPGYGAVSTAYADAMSRLADAIARTIPEDGSQRWPVCANSH
jgi:uncharacterized lipoprotein YmbA